MGIIGRVFGKSRTKSGAADEHLAADRARQGATASSGPLQTAEEIAHIRSSMEAELDAQRQRRTQPTTPEA